MKKLIPLLAFFALLLPVAASADPPSLVASGGQVTITVSGLAPDTVYWESFRYRSDVNPRLGCNSGAYGASTDDNGTLVMSWSEASLTCHLTAPGAFPGTLKAWVRDPNSVSWNDPPVITSDGTEAVAFVTLS